MLIQIQFKRFKRFERFKVEYEYSLTRLTYKSFNVNTNTEVYIQA